MRIRLLVFSSPLFAALLFFACNGEKGTNAHRPPPPVINWDTTFVDGDVALGEPFIDVNDNGIWDGPSVLYGWPQGEPFTDLSHDGKYEGPNDPWKPGIPWVDVSGWGAPYGGYDLPDSVQQDGEPNYFICAKGQGCVPVLHNCLEENEPICIPLWVTSPDTALTVTVAPNGFVSFEHGVVCWIPEGSGMQVLTIIAHDSHSQADTLNLSIYVYSCEGSS
jgi:hypothetical protein